MHETHEKSEVHASHAAASESKGGATGILYGLLVLAVAALLFNQYMIFNLNGEVVKAASATTSLAIAAGAPTARAVSTSAPLTASSGSADFASQVLPKGVPAGYGAEFGISYDNAAASNQRVAPYDNSIKLSGDKLNRYIAITTQISCEYCCGAEAITFKNGQAACGCAHSAMMRGLAKYLLDKHASEYTDAQILEELAKWKALFFPRDMVAKAQVMQGKGLLLKGDGSVDYTALGSNKYRGVEKGGSTAGSAGGAGSLPSQVGGC